MRSTFRSGLNNSIFYSVNFKLHYKSGSSSPGRAWIKRLFFKDDNHESGTIECISDNTMKEERGARKGKIYVDANEITKLFNITAMFKSNELTVINNH